MKRKLIIPITIIALALFSCAQVKYAPVSANDDGNGIRYYQSSPYLLVYPNGKGGLTTQLLYIADPAKKMEARPKTFMANAKTTMEFEKGILKSTKTENDASALPTAIIGAIKSAAPALLAAANEVTLSSKTKEIAAPHLYKIIVKGGKVSFIGGSGDKTITVNLLPQEDKKTK